MYGLFIANTMKHTTEFEKTPENGLIWQDRSSLKDYIFSLPEGKYYLMAVKVAERRTLEQNSLLWTRYQQIANYLTAAGVIRSEKDLKPVECTAEMVHEYCKNTPELSDLLPKRLELILNESGEYIVRQGKGTTTKLTRSANDIQAFSDYYEAVGAHFQTNFPDLILT